jgi:hypothetical protein
MPPGPANASPPIFSNTRLYFGTSTVHDLPELGN